MPLTQAQFVRDNTFVQKPAIRRLDERPVQGPRPKRYLPDERAPFE